MFKDVNEAIAYVEKKVNKKTVDEYKEIMNRHHLSLQVPHIVHVTGTNGKGSTIHYLSEILIKKGYRVGTFTSPYLISYHDRFCINGIPIDDKNLLDIIQEYQELIEEEKLSKFEIDILIMIVYFNRENLDYALVEVGIGGLEDKTNIISGELEIITNIGHDHMPRLGNTLLDVCKHKAGIIKENTQVVSGVTQMDCRQYIKEIAQLRNSTVTFVDAVYPFNYGHLAIYQQRNITLACLAAKKLGIDISVEEVQEVIDSTFWKGRFETFTYQGREIIIDGAHNKDGIEALLETLLARKQRYTIIFSALRDKDYPLMIAMLERYYDVYVTVFEDERRMNLEDLSSFKHTYASFQEALEEAMKEPYPIVMTGSLHFISYVRKFLT